jgi:uncharacterized protein involved in propanediol utilization
MKTETVKTGAASRRLATALPLSNEPVALGYAQDSQDPVADFLAAARLFEERLRTT